MPPDCGPVVGMAYSIDGGLVQVNQLTTTMAHLRVRGQARQGALRGHESGQAEVRELHPSLAVYEYVLWLDIPVDDSLTVSVL